MLTKGEKRGKGQSLAIVLHNRKNLTNYKQMQNYHSKIDFILCWFTAIKINHDVEDKHLLESEFKLSQS